ncbi:MAG: Cell division protein FtsK [uncultured Thermomicrobiales bacterium]|uniref:Cell division protein FtsK n=1 Tax=uncultured Thermomicrobiales bacterium TaxID=1645740 RepID=A0A6J4U9P6_9BACT|nr:MAG: Cell division protein FtsK [uncultured Thermomicrobiales bacterium]
MEPAMLEKLRGDLERRRADVVGQLESLSGQSKDLSEDENSEGGGLSNHMADSGSDVAEQEQVATISLDLSEHLAQIDKALKRMDDGTYGLSQLSGKPINPERLEAFPWVEFDVEEQAEIERNRVPMNRS